MGKRVSGLFILALTASCLGAAEEKAGPSSFGISFSGFIKTDIIHDSRQTVNLREGHFLLFPKPDALDADGRDINAKSSFNILSIQTRLAGRVTGPDAFGAKTSGLIEGEFFGTADGDMNGFRLRHAYVRLNWKRTEVLVGQFWHAMFIADSYPDVVSFNTGAPFQPFARAPQLRVAQTFGDFSLIATAMSQRDFASNGPEGASSAYLRNAAIPELNLKLQYDRRSGKAGSAWLIGAGIDYMNIQPRLATEAGYRTDQTLSSLSAMAYFKFRAPKWTFKAEAVRGENTHHLTMLGGYAAEEMIDPARKEWNYTPIRTTAFWSEIHTNGLKWKTGIFGGYSKNLGSSSAFRGPAYGRGTNIDRVVRVAPRVLVNSGKLRLAAEVEWTSARYGTPDARGKVLNAISLSNMRLLVATYYFF